MTKQEYEKKYDECNNWLGNIRVCRKYIASLEAEVANLNDWLTAWKESFTLAQAEIAKLKAQEEK
jgi:hypothetical protein